jgi:hypothetical protein
MKLYLLKIKKIEIMNSEMNQTLKIKYLGALRLQ